MTSKSDEVADSLAQAILTASGDAVLATDRDGHIRFWNPGAVRIFGFANEDAIGAPLDLIIPERLRKRHWEGWNHVMATGQTKYGAGDLLAVPALTKDGRQISVEFTIVLLHDANRQIIGMGATMRDVTARFEDTRRLRRQLAEQSQSANAGGLRT